MGWDVISLFSDVYFRAFIILLICLVLAKLTLVFFKKIVERLVAKSKVKKSVVLRIETPLVLIIVLAGVELAIREIATSSAILENFIDSVIIFIIAYMFVRIISIMLHTWRKAHDDHHHQEYHSEILPLINSLSKLFLFGIAIILTLQIWGVQVGALLASLGLIGIVLGFAFQDSLKNIFGGISLTADNSIKKGDVVRLDSGEVGEVEEINLRSTKIKTFDDNFLIVPNGLLANSKIHNYAQPTSTVRIVIPINVAYGSKVSEVKKVLLETIKDREDVLHLPARDVRFMKMDEYSLSFDFIFFIADYHNKFTMIDQITTASYEALQQAGIQIPFPTRTIYQNK